MKLTKEQLRRIINETVRARLTEDQYMTDVGDAVEGHSLGEADAETVDPSEMLTTALVTKLVDVVDSSFSAGIYEIMQNLDSDENLLRPGRYEDVEHFANKAVDAALKDPELKDALVTSAMDVFRSMMRPGK